jgi:hypothetical protein
LCPKSNSNFRRTKEFRRGNQAGTLAKEMPGPVGRRHSTAIQPLGVREVELPGGALWKTTKANRDSPKEKSRPARWRKRLLRPMHWNECVARGKNSKVALSKRELNRRNIFALLDVVQTGLFK